ncbi:MAG: hypothetical protein V3T84_09030 [Phycisphaerales bacterium]
MSNENEQLMVSRVIEPDATSEQWDELTAAAISKPTLWRLTAEAVRDHHAMTRAVNASISIADDVSTTPRTSRLVHRLAVDSAPSERPQLLRWSGWAVAALVALAWVSGLSNVQPTGNGYQAGTGSQVLSAADLLHRYLVQGRREGRVFDEVPEKILVQSRPLPTGDAVEVIFIRQILERTTLPGLYHYQGEDESGRPTLVRFEANAKPPM